MGHGGYPHSDHPGTASSIPRGRNSKKRTGEERSDEVVTLAGMGRERGGTVSWARPGQAKGRKGKGMLVAAGQTSVVRRLRGAEGRLLDG